MLIRAVVAFLGVRVLAFLTAMLSERIGLALAVLSLCGLGQADGQITSDTYFYGESPAVYPSRRLPISMFHSLILMESCTDVSSCSKWHREW